MSAPEAHQAAGLAYRQTGPVDGQAVLLVHGYPSSSYMWLGAMHALAEHGYRCVAPDLPGFGDTPPDPPGSWEHHCEALERFASALDLDRPALVLHDWGVMIGLRWACQHPDSVSALAISDGGFFADRRWHDLANVLRTPGDGERLIESFTRDGFEQAMRQASGGMTAEAIAEYWKCFADPVRRGGHLELYRSGDFHKLEPYRGQVAGLGVPTLLLWGELDRFAGVAMARRFHQEIPGSELVVFSGAGHFVWEDEPAATAVALVEFLRRQLPA